MEPILKELVSLK